MASNVKRFIPRYLYSFVILSFVGLSLCQVKGADAQSFSDTLQSLQPPFALTLEKTGPVRLAGLLFDADAQGLSDLLQPGMKVRARLLSDTPDRYGRKPAHLFLKDGRWIQGELVRKQQATPFPYPGEGWRIRDLYLHETPQAENALEEDMSVDRFAIVQGRIVDVAEIKGTTYLNFGGNWRTDFTVRLDKKVTKIFRAFGFDLPHLKGKEIRIRGWVFSRNGPMISPQHPNQLEVIEK